MTNTTGAAELPEALTPVPDSLLKVIVHHEALTTRDEVRRMAHELATRRAQVSALQGLAATCYAGLGAECNLPENWLDVFNAAANGEPFSTEGLLPYTALSAAQAGAPAGYVLVPMEPSVHQEWEGKEASSRVSSMAEACKIYKAMLAAAPTPPAQAADSVPEDAARLERERICAAIKAEDDYCVDHGDYMLDSDDCIKIVRGEWARPDFAVDTARKQGGA